MEVQTLPLSPVADFSFDSTATSPYATAPSSPQSTIPFFWEHKPGIPKQTNYQQHDTDFAFGYLERHSISAADELFDCGKIKPLKPPPRLHFPNDSPRSSKPPNFRFKDVLSKKDFDPFSEALKQTPCVQTQTQPEENIPSNRGRESRQRTTKGNRHKVSRSLSPFRLSDIVTNRKTSTDESPASGLSLTWYNKWNLKNLLLFRSASEGSVTTRKDPLKKYTMLEKDESMMVSAEEEIKGKTTLPYKSGLLGCLRFHQNAGSVMKQ